MDNAKTGALIRELRREKGITQKQLADALHVTDKAVSKWERGICAPDLALLEPLANELGCTILELISGERVQRDGESITDTKETEEAVKTAIDYSAGQIKQRLSSTRRTYICVAALCLAVIIGFTALHLWVQGYFYIMGKDTAPGGEWSITLYSRSMGTGSGNNLPWVRGGYSYIVRNADKSKGEYRVTYQKSEYMGHWWSPDGERMIMEFRQGNQTKIQMTTWAKSSTANLNAAFPYADAEYQFLQWSKDGKMMLIYYCMEDETEGYFWYDVEKWDTVAEVELK